MELEEDVVLPPVPEDKRLMAFDTATLDVCGLYKVVPMTVGDPVELVAVVGIANKGVRRVVEDVEVVLNVNDVVGVKVLVLFKTI